MTRDEAIKKFSGAWPSGSGGGNENWAGVWVDSFAALGVIKLDEPKSATEKFKDALIDQGWSPQGVDDALRQAGVKIVEK